MNLTRFLPRTTALILLVALFFAARQNASAQNKPLGTDVSSYQGSTVNWNTVRNDGVSFAWAKAGEATPADGYIDPDADYSVNIANAKAAGVYIGSYYFAHPEIDLGTAGADTEAAYFWSVAGKNITNGGYFLMPMLDVEVSHSNVTYMSSWVNEWCQDIVNYAKNSNNVAITPTVYCSTSFAAANFNSTVTQWIPWLAAYPSCTGNQCGSSNPQGGSPGSTTPWSTWSIWQYGDTNWSGGDSDIFNGTTNQFLLTFLIGNTNPAPPTAPAGATVYWDPSGTKASPGSGGSGNWDTTSTNWYYAGTSDVVYAVGGDNAVFSGPAGTVTMTTSLAADSLTFNTAGYTIAGSSETLTLESPGNIVVPAGTMTSLQCIMGGVGFNLSGGGSMYLNNAGNFSGTSYVTGPNTALIVATDHDSGNDGVTINLVSGGIYQDNDATAGDQFLLPGCAVALGTGGGIFENPNANLTMSNYITGAGSLTLIGTSHILTLTDAGNNYTGGTIVQAGTVKASAAGTLGSTAGTLQLTGGTLDLGAASQTVGAVTFASGTLTDGTLTGSSYAGQSGTISAVLAGTAAFTKTTASTLTLSASNTYTGNTIISAGSLTLGATGSILHTANISIAAGAIFNASAIPAFALGSGTSITASGTATPAILQGGTTVGFGARPITLTYDGSHPALTISNGTLSLAGNAFTVNGSALAAGSSYPLIRQTSGSISGSGSYTVTGTAVGAAGTTPVISVSGSNVLLTINYSTAVALGTLTNATYGQSVTLSATVAPSPSGGTVQFYDNAVAFGSPVSLSGGVATLSTTALPAGTNAITASYSGTTFYSASSSGAGSLVISPASLVITAAAQNKTYGQTLAASGTNFSAASLQNGDMVGSVALATSGAVATAAVGSYSLTPSAATGGTFNPANYSISYVSGSLSVTPAPLTVTANSITLPYGAPIPPLTVSYTNFVNGQNLGSSDIAGTPALTTVTNGVGGVYVITNSLGSLTSTNYSFNLVNGTLTVTNALSTNVVTSSENPALPGDSVTFTSTISAVAPSLAIPTGSVQFLLDGTNFGSTVTLSNGIASSLAISNLAHGYHTNEADYAGTTNILGSTNTLVELVNTPPFANPAYFPDPSNAPLAIAISTLLTNASDADNDPLTLASVSATSTNGGTITTNATTIFYTPATNGPDAFNYTVSDSYGAMATNLVLITIPSTNASPGSFNGIALAGGVAQLTFTGTPGATYLLQGTTSLAPPAIWITLSTNIANGSGQFSFSDTNAANLPARFYRTVVSQ